MTAYSTSVADPAIDHERLLALWGTGLSHQERPGAKLAWYYRANPEGTPLVLLLHHRDARLPIGTASAGTRRMRLGDRVLKAGAMVDFVVLPQHRTLFPALFLQKAIVRHALASHDLLFGLPNPRSVAAILRAGYRFVGTRERRVRVLRSTPYLARYLPRYLAHLVGPAVDLFRSATEALRQATAPGFRVQWLARPDARFDDLAARACDPTLVTGVRDEAFLAWRFADCPLRRHRFFTLVSDAGERLAGYAVCEAQQHVLQVRDFLVDPAIRGAWVRLWAELSRAAHAQGFASLAVDFLGPAATQRRLAAAGFVSRGGQPVHAVLPKGLEDLASPERWYLSDADDDV